MNLNSTPNKINTGYIQSTPDPRNYNLSRLVAPINVFPEEFELDISNIQVEDQGDIGQCVSEGINYHYAYVYKDLFSLGFVYGNRSDDDTQGQGMQPHQALKHLKDEGNVLRKDFPIVAEMPQIREEVMKVKDSLLPKASQYKIASYAELKTIDDIKNALYQLKTPVLIGINVYLTFAILDPTGFAPVPIPALMDDKYNYGGHAITVYGWDKRGFKILNSWGTKSWKDGGWSETGKCVLDYNYPILEAWSITDKQAEPPQPTPINKWYRVQVGAFRNLDYAKARKDELINKGFDVYMVNINGLYKLQLNAFSVRSNADAFLQKVINAGYKDAFIVYY